MALTQKMMDFCREYVANGGNATQAYLTAYNSDSPVSAGIEGYRLLQRDDIQDYLQSLNKPLEEQARSERQEKRDILWSFIRDVNLSTNERLNALNLLAKFDGDYTMAQQDEKQNNMEKVDTDTLLRLVKDA